MKYQIRVSETRSVIEEVATKEQAINLVVKYEKSKELGFYEIYDTEKQVVIY